mgnify:CR=1 FL=1
MVLEEFVYEGHKVSFHSIGYLEVVCLDRGHHVLNHLDDFSAESHCSLYVMVCNKKTFFIVFLSICHWTQRENFLFDHGHYRVIF